MFGIFQAILRWFGFKSKRAEQAVHRAADAEFTGSVSGIRDAYDIARDKLVGQYKQLRDAVAQVEMVLEQDRDRLAKLNAQEADLIRRRDGALALFEQAQTAGDARAAGEHQAAFERFDERIQRIETEQAELDARIAGQADGMSEHLRRLTKLQDEIRALPEEKARQIAEFVSNQKLIELNDRLGGLQTDLDRGPIDAVRQANLELSARARVSRDLAGTDVDALDARYESAGARESAGERMQAMLAARKAARITLETDAEAAPDEGERPAI